MGDDTSELGFAFVGAELLKGRTDFLLCSESWCLHRLTHKGLSFTVAIFFFFFNIYLFILLFFKINLFIYFLAALGLRCCARAFSSCSERGLLFVAVHGLLIVVTSLVAEHGL